MNVPAPVPPPAGTINASPTIGAIIGGAAGVVIATKLGLGLDQPAGIATVSAVSGLLTALFHWLGEKSGVPGLG